MPIGPGGEPLPYGPEGSQGTGQDVKRRRAGGRPKHRQLGGGSPQIAPAQTAMHQPAQIGPEWPATDPMGLGAYGAMGSVPGVGMQGAVDPRAVMNTTRRRFV